MMNYGEFQGPMMYQGYFGFFGFLCIVTWILLIAALASFVRWMWKKGNNVK